MKDLLNKIEIKISFFIVLIFTFFLNIIDYFFVIFIMVFLHELAHIVLAKIFGLKLSKIIISPIGQMAILKDLELLPKYKKICIVLAGPFLSLCLAFIFSLFKDFDTFRNINLSIAFFNLLPIYPLDGGRIYQYMLGSKIGDLKASLIIKKVSIFFSYFIFILGFLQLIFISYNLSLICLGFYLIKLNNNEFIKFTFEFYKYLKIKKQLGEQQVLKVRNILVNKSMLNKNIFMSLTQDYYTIINIFDDGEIRWKITESEFIEKIQYIGITGKVYDLLQDLEILD